jgi:hypothetical protein
MHPAIGNQIHVPEYAPLKLITPDKYENSLSRRFTFQAYDEELKS